MMVVHYCVPSLVCFFHMLFVNILINVIGPARIQLQKVLVTSFHVILIFYLRESSLLGHMINININDDFYPCYGLD